MSATNPRARRLPWWTLLVIVTASAATTSAALATAVAYLIGWLP